MKSSAHPHLSCPRLQPAALRRVLSFTLALLLAPLGFASQVVLNWADNSTNESGFYIERAVSDLVFSQVASVSANATSYTDTGLAAATKYYYRVRAFNASGASDYSNMSNATTPAGVTNTAPTLTNPGNLTMTAGAAPTARAFSVGDAETAASSLVLTGASSNTTLVPAANIAFGGSGANRTVTISPASGQIGSATITLQVSDGILTTSTTFILTVNAAANTAPTISNVSNVSVNLSTSTGAIAFTVGDAQTAAGSLTVTRASSNTTLVPTANIVLGGSGANRTVTVTPASGKTGTATITLTVSDGSLTATDTFVLTVSNTNTAPTISNLSNVTVNPSTSTGALAFTVGDAQTAAGSLTVTRASSNTTLVPTANIVLGGSGANRTVSVTPASGKTGTATITVTVSDGSLTASDTFVLTVTASNTAPTITNISNVTVSQGSSTGALAFTIGDAQTAAASLSVTRASSNTTLVPTANVVLGGSGANRTVNVTPAASQTGSATITVTVSDGTLTATDSFVVTVTSSNTAPTITNPGNQTVTAGSSPVALSFTVGDAQTSAASLSVSGASSNTTLAPNANIAFGGSGANRTVTVTPASGQTGSATITLTVSDGSLTTNTTFVLTVNAAQTTSGLVAAYNFNEGSGTTVADSSGNGNTGTITGATWTTSGKYGQALNFNGSTNMVTIPSSASLNVTSAVTIEAWAYPTANQSGWHAIMSKETDAYYLLVGTVTTSMTPTGGATINGTSAPMYATSATAINAWTHLAMTYDGTTAKLYVNGVLVSSKALKGAIQANSNPLRIGTNVPYGMAFVGRIDEVRVYNRALSSAELQTDMNTAVASAAGKSALMSGEMSTMMAASQDTVAATTSDASSDAQIAATDLAPATAPASVTEISNAASSATSQVSDGHVVTFSTQAAVKSSTPLVSSFVISGTGTRSVLLRGVGPTLSDLGVANPLANPSIQVYDAKGKQLVNAGSWAGNATLAAAFDRIGVFPLAAGSTDAAVIVTLPAGAYTAKVTTGSSTGGTALAEISDAGDDSVSATAHLSTVATRGSIGTGSTAIVSGLTVGGSSPKRLLIRGVGPALKKAGESGTLANPRLEVFDSSNHLLAQNDNWQTSVTVDASQVASSAAAIKALVASLGLAALDDGSLDAAVVVTLAPGVYSLQVSNAGKSAGTAALEVYELP